MLGVIVALAVAVLITIVVVFALVREVRIINARDANTRRDVTALRNDVTLLRKDVNLCLEENMLTTISENSVHGIPEMNRWPKKPEPPPVPEPPKVTLEMRVSALWAWFKRWWRRLVNL